MREPGGIREREPAGFPEPTIRGKRSLASRVERRYSGGRRTVRNQVGIQLSALNFRTSSRVAVAATVAIASVALAIGCGGGGSKSSSTPTRSAPVAASVSDLQNLASSLKHPIYWAGPKKGYTYELTQTRDGSVYIRYLPAGVNIGDGRPDFLTVGTYPQANAYQNVSAALKRKGARKTPTRSGGLAVQNVTRAPSVYMAFPRSSLLVEVFSPSPSTARSLVRHGQVRPLG